MENTQAVRFGPEKILTGWGRRVCDGAVIELTQLEEEGSTRIIAAKVRELHDINIAGRRAEREIAWFLKRGLALIEKEGLTLIMEEDVYYVPPHAIEHEGIRYRQFCTPAHNRGPFSRK